jgi:ACR3 family arsenite efflux pump ArsB
MVLRAFICTVVGIGIGLLLGDRIELISKWEILGVNVPIATELADDLFQNGAGNIFELGVVVAIVVFGPNSVALTTVIGMLIELPIMLSLVALAKKWKH